MSRLRITDLNSERYHLKEPIDVDIITLVTPRSEKYFARPWSSYLTGPCAETRELAVQELLKKMVEVRASLDDPMTIANPYASHAYALLKERFVRC